MSNCTARDSITSMKEFVRSKCLLCLVFCLLGLPVQYGELSSTLATAHMVFSIRIVIYATIHTCRPHCPLQRSPGKKPWLIARGVLQTIITAVTICIGTERFVVGRDPSFGYEILHPEICFSENRTLETTDGVNQG